MERYAINILEIKKKEVVVYPEKLPPSWAFSFLFHGCQLCTIICHLVGPNYLFLLLDEAQRYRIEEIFQMNQTRGISVLHHLTLREKCYLPVQNTTSIELKRSQSQSPNSHLPCNYREWTFVRKLLFSRFTGLKIVQIKGNYASRLWTIVRAKSISYRIATWRITVRPLKDIAKTETRRSETMIYTEYDRNIVIEECLII